MKILAIGGSIRASGHRDQDLLRLVFESDSHEDFIKKVEPYTQKQFEGKTNHYPISNSEVMAGAALMGAKSCKADVDYFSLRRLFPRRELPVNAWNADQLGLDEEIGYADALAIDEKTKDILVSKVSEADGIVLSSPIYFGDRSSVANKLMQFALSEGILDEKAFASVSVGAKRNGGQETTNIFVLYEAIKMGAYVVGNGPKSCQYGGTAHAGDMGSICKDAWGLETAWATGKRVSQVANIIRQSNDAYCERATKVLILITMDRPNKLLQKRIKEHVTLLQRDHPKVEFEIINLIDMTIDRCFACSICPIPELRKPGEHHDTYACIVQNSRDSVNFIRDRILNADALVLAGLNLHDMSDVTYRYQAFTERTRFIRRNDFELSNYPITGFLLNEVGASSNTIFELKVMTSYMRHNAIMLNPITEHLLDNKVIVNGYHHFSSFIDRAQKIRQGRDNAEPIEVSYKATGAGGYGDGRLDNTAAYRR